MESMLPPDALESTAPIRPKAMQSPGGTLRMDRSATRGGRRVTRCTRAYSSATSIVSRMAVRAAHGWDRIGCGQQLLGHNRLWPCSCRHRRRQALGNSSE
jgi:hypothetical protein